MATLPFSVTSAKCQDYESCRGLDENGTPAKEQIGDFQCLSIDFMLQPIQRRFALRYPLCTHCFLYPMLINREECENILGEFTSFKDKGYLEDVHFKCCQEDFCNGFPKAEEQRREESELVSEEPHLVCDRNT